MMRLSCELISKMTPTIKVEIATSEYLRVEELMEYLFILILISSFHKGCLVPSKKMVQLNVDDQYPTAVSCILQFGTHADALSFIEEIKP